MSDCSNDSDLQEPEEEIVLFELTENNLPDFKLLAQAVLPVKYSVSPCTQSRAGTGLKISNAA